tara:strand:+ start:1955 stop:2407 length:453 start_codon:yes stop_codon:yes gene_type:complete
VSKFIKNYNITNNTMEKILDLLNKQSFTNEAHNTCTKNGYQTGNIIDIFPKDLLKEMLPDDDFHERCFHIHYIEYLNGGYQKRHNHENTERYSFIIYLNDSDGFTYFEEPIDEKITPERGRVLIFRSDVNHGAETSFKNKRVLVGAMDKL